MDYKCSICGDNVGQDLLKFIEHTDNHIIDVIKEKHPEWQEADGLCRKCVDYYRQQKKGEENS